ncbi:Universal stress protein A [Serratia plymuthica]|nr:Universal stress protein A [Serratia plymuthica]
MGYQNVLVTVAVAADSHRLVEKAVSIVRPSNGKITLLSTIANPEMYNNFAGPMLGDLRALMEEETLLFYGGTAAAGRLPNNRYADRSW